MLTWLSAARSFIANLRPRHWLLLIIVYSGRAMLPVLPADVAQTEWMRALQTGAQFFVIFWMPYMFMRAMAGHERPAIPTLGFLWFAGAAVVFAFAMAVLPTLVHLRFLNGDAGEYAQAWFLLAGVVGAILTARLLPICAGTATEVLSPLEMRWWAGMADTALPFCFTVGAAYLVWKLLDMAVPAPSSAFTMRNIFWSHVEQALTAGYVLLICALAVAAAQHCADINPRLQEGAPPR
ncbi:hypothetical protein KCG44_04480 [Pacificimonas sp. WHA3]|uniref:Uncharacterized protein n=1 Tax=Pacificimonas pallii TaxID=2827236 RepID=A0ABS6SDW3_9SPHN|nr:hypothetical protein [Pacificimonas pallii]MBV7256037.1 hypothetical protein [Pacificimonas pallii]